MVSRELLKEAIIKKIRNYYSDLGQAIRGRVSDRTSTQYGKKIKDLTPHKKDIAGAYDSIGGRGSFMKDLDAVRFNSQGQSAYKRDAKGLGKIKEKLKEKISIMEGVKNPTYRQKKLKERFDKQVEWTDKEKDLSEAKESLFKNLNRTDRSTYRKNIEKALKEYKLKQTYNNRGKLIDAAKVHATGAGAVGLTGIAGYQDYKRKKKHAAKMAAKKAAKKG